MEKRLFTLLLFFSITSFFSQRGKDLAGNITATAIVNLYTPLTTDASMGNTNINVLSSAGYSVGDLIYIIQMRGASVNCFSVGAGSGPFGSAFGKITNYNNAGNNEYLQIAQIAGNVITVDCGLRFNYTAAGRVQVIRVPRYTTLNIANTGTILCPAWNGTIGGVIAIEVNGATTINATGRIDASATGFRGGAAVAKTGGFGFAGQWGHNNPSEGAPKGEGIAGDAATYSVNFQAVYCKGAIANGGGGGNGNNAGGGGGANAGDTSAYTGTGNPDISVPGYVTAWNLESPGFAATSSSGGGKGGYTYSTAGVSPLTSAPNSSVWGAASDYRRVEGGVGGRPLNYNTGRLFLGGGGGAGDENDAFGGSGGRGGGIINILSYGSVSGGGQIISNGQVGGNTNAPSVFGVVTGRDGAGGGGGGGAILVNSSGVINSLTLSAVGGRGGNQQMRNGGGGTSQAYGPGGGGGGGYIGTTPAAVTTTLSGGANGIVVYLSGAESCQIDNLFPANGSTMGGSGTGNSTLTAVSTITSLAGVSVCSNNSATVTAATNGTGTIGWYSATAGGTLLGTGSPFTTSVFPTPGTFTIYAGFCPGGVYRVPVTITVTAGPTLTPVSTTICAGLSGTVSVSGATTYSWNTGPVTNSISASPTVTTVYTVTGTTGGCSSATTATITVNPSGTISVNSPTMCNTQTVTLSAGAASSYTWSQGSNNQTVAVSPSVTTVYTINATNLSGCLVSNTSTVTVSANPTVSVANATICSGTSTIITASGATTYSWNTGPTTASISLNPLVTTIYTVTGTTGSCNNVKTVTVNVNNTPTVSVNSQSICSGASAVLTASGATTYSWNTGPTTSSISVSPGVTTVYTVTGTSSNCTANTTSTVSVVTTPTVTVNSPTVCAGNSVAITASGASSYSWSNGPVTPSISVSPTVTTIYTVTGTNGGTCTNVKTSTVSVSPQASVSLNANTFNICGGQSASIIATANGTYSWSTGATTNSISTLIAGVYNVTVTNSCGIAVQSATVVSGAAPAFTINATSSVVCPGQTVTLNTAGSSGTFTWSTGAGNTPSVNVTNGGIYTATLTNACGTAVYSINIIDGAGSNLNLSASSNTICAGGSVTLTASGSGTFAWSTGAGNVPAITVTNTGVYTASISDMCGTSTATISVIGGPTPSLNIVPSSSLFCSGQTVTLSAIGSPGTYSWTNGTTGTILTTASAGIFTAVITNSCGTNTETFNVVFQSAPQVSLTANKNTICPNETATLTANGINGGVTYSWSSSATNTNNIETVNSAGNYIVTYTNTCGVSSASITVNQSTLSPDFNFTPNGGTAPVAITFNNNSANNVINQWSFGNGQNSSNATGDNSQYTSAGVYTVTLIIENADGCVASISKTLEVTDQGLGIIPEVLTPNNDGKNDLFEIKGINNYPDNELQIFNRWGNLVYKTKAYNNTWDGTPNKGGGKLPAGTYFYLLNLGDSNNQVFRGFVELMY